MATLSSSDRRDGETENIANKGDIEESLEKSYLLMKTKLDELEQYNRTLESQLGSIFSSISKTVNKVQSERGESVEEESDSNWKTVSPDSRSDEDCQVTRASAWLVILTTALALLADSAVSDILMSAARENMTAGLPSPTRHREELVGSWL